MDEPCDVLLVDDEPRILRGLRRMLRDPRWRIHLAEGADEALTLLDQVDVEVVVTDYQMPGMNGADLLEELRRSHASVVRIMLTGEISQAPAMRTTVSAHQFLRKPCEPEHLMAALERARALDGVLDDPDLRAIAGSLGSLPSPRTAWTALQRLLEDPTTREADVADVVAADTAMSAKVLQLANSSFLGVPRTVLGVRDAVAHLGVALVRTLSSSTTAFRPRLDDASAASASLDAMQVHAQACAALIAEVAEDGPTADAAVSAALLQDLGALLLAERDADRFEALVERARHGGGALHAIERDELGFTHEQVGHHLALLWGLPQDLLPAIAGHHHDTDADDDASDVARLVRAARLVLAEARPDLADPLDEPHAPAVELERLLGDDVARWIEAATQLAGAPTAVVA